MDIRLAFGKSGLALRMPDDLDITVLEPEFVPGVADPVGALRQAMRRPIGSRPGWLEKEPVRPTRKVAI